jgi:hypothetical protein
MAKSVRGLHSCLISRIPTLRISISIPGSSSQLLLSLHGFHTFYGARVKEACFGLCASSLIQNGLTKMHLKLQLQELSGTSFETIRKIVGIWSNVFFSTRLMFCPRFWGLSSLILLCTTNIEGLAWPCLTKNHPYLFEISIFCFRYKPNVLEVYMGQVEV